MIKILNIQGKTGYELMHGDYDVLAELKDNCTNGDVIKAMFSNIEIEGIGGLEGCQCVAVSIGLGTSYFALDWWNAPYERSR